MLTLSYGYKKPESGDKGPVVFPALEDNIDQLNDHDHDGANSAPLTPRSVVAETQTLLAANWVATSHGNYRQLVTVPAGMDFDKLTINFRLPSGHYLYPLVEKVSTTTYYVYTNDNSTNFLAVYGG